MFRNTFLDKLIEDRPNLKMELFDDYEILYSQIPFEENQFFIDWWYAFTEPSIVNVVENLDNDIWFLRSSFYLIKFNSKQDLLDILPALEEIYDYFQFTVEIFGLNSKKWIQFDSGIPNYCRFNFKLTN